MQQPPETLEVLLQRAKKAAGLQLQQIAQHCEVAIPKNLRREKGWVGQLLEAYLGATAGSKAEPDFLHLGVELKTLPVDKQGKPKESTFVSSIPLMSLSQITWETSVVRKKLSQVLWIPIEADPSIPLEQRRLGMPILWRPSEQQRSVLREDWEELTEMICLGHIEKISARFGQYLQVRPKGANSKALVPCMGPDGAPIMTLPRGFYLRAQFTAEIIAQRLLSPEDSGTMP